MTTGKDLESPFGIEEMFYSKTDSKGIITAGNKVFVRVSEFSENELLRSPHNIIRHHEMPRSVFKVFWNFLKAGKPVAAYVKNRSKHGRFYWVLAMAFPIETGYLSIRLKPTSPLFSRAEDIYERVLSAERQGITLEDGINLIKDNLRSIGFSSYEDFMKIALIEELVSRDELLTKSPRPGDEPSISSSQQKSSIVSDSCVQSVLVSFHQTGRLFERINEMIADSKVITETSEKVKYLTLNMTVASAKLGKSNKSKWVFT